MSYRDDPEVRRRYQKRWRKTPAGLASMNRYRRSKKGKATQRRYVTSEGARRNNRKRYHGLSPSKKRARSKLNKILHERANRKKKLAGICYQCSKKALQGRTLCRKHRNIQRADATIQYYEQVKKKRCTRCGKRAAKGKRMCQRHLDLYAARARAKYVPTGYNRGPRHRISADLFYSDRVKKGLCTRCDKPAAKGKRKCQFHLDSEAANRRAKHVPTGYNCGPRHRISAA